LVRASARSPSARRVVPLDFDDPDISWRLLSGDARIAPGVEANSTPGHTPGHQRFVVTLADGGDYVFAFDAGDLAENFDPEMGAGSSAAPPRTRAARSCALKAIAAERGFPLIPGHEPEVWRALPEQLMDVRA
jgi:glyoxylase-like metal-dependent hydrolase (beta-lactamase superfamily II)